jgi:kanamycin kinase
MQQLPGAPQLPADILDRYSAWTFRPVSVHPGNSVMYRIAHGDEVRFLKVVRRGWFPSAEAEASRMLWARAHVPVPDILDRGASAAATWFVSRAIPGEDATNRRFRSDLAGLVQRLAGALRQFHSMPVAECPFSFRIDEALEHVVRRFRHGEIDPARDFHTEHSELSADLAVKRLLATRPAAEDVVVCHGDYCVPNILFRDSALAGFVDLGEMGVADRWWDLAVATWSLTWNFGPGYEAMFLDAYGVKVGEQRLQYYRLLYDLVS